MSKQASSETPTASINSLMTNTNLMISPTIISGISTSTMSSISMVYSTNNLMIIATTIATITSYSCNILITISSAATSNLNYLKSSSSSSLTSIVSITVHETSTGIGSLYTTYPTPIHSSIQNNIDNTPDVSALVSSMMTSITSSKVMLDHSSLTSYFSQTSVHAHTAPSTTLHSIPIIPSTFITHSFDGSTPNYSLLTTSSTFIGQNERQNFFTSLTSNTK